MRRNETPDGPDATPGTAAAPPLLRIVTADTSPEEVAAIVAVLSAMPSGDTAPARRRPEWSSPHRQVRQSHSHGPGGWRSSGLPQHRGRGA